MKKLNFYSNSNHSLILQIIFVFLTFLTCNKYTIANALSTQPLKSNELAQFKDTETPISSEEFNAVVDLRSNLTVASSNNTSSEHGQGAIEVDKIEIVTEPEVSNDTELNDFLRSEIKQNNSEITITKSTNLTSVDPSKFNYNNLIYQACKRNDNTTAQACFEYCTRDSLFDIGKCSSDQQWCTCENSKDGQNKKVKLYKPKDIVQTKRIPLSKVKLTVSDIGEFDCDNSPEAKSICQVYCTMKGATHSACSLAKTSCLCFKTISKTKTLKSKKFPAISTNNHKKQSNRVGKQLIEEQVIGMGLMSQKSFPFWSPPFQPQPPRMGCTVYSCVDNCPRHCDNLCTQNLQCFCSCPEDSFNYDYFDGGSIPTFSYYG